MNCVLIQASGSMAAQGLREAMFTAAMSFAPCDIYANDEGRILYCGHLGIHRVYTDTVMMPMTGREDSAPLFTLMGFMQDYKTTIFVDDGDTGLTNALQIKKMFECLKEGGIKKISWKELRQSGLHTVIVRDYGAATVGVETSPKDG